MKKSRAKTTAESVQAPSSEPAAPLADVVAQVDPTNEPITQASLPGFVLTDNVAGTLGIGEHGRPMCPDNHGELEIADDKIPAADAITQAADKLSAAKQLPLIDTAPVFNTDGAYLELERMAVDADRLMGIRDDDKDRWKKSTKAYDTAAELYVSAGLEFHRRRLAKIDAEESRSETAPAVDLYAAVRTAGQILLPGTIEAWTDDQRAAVQAWTTDPSKERPAALGRAHIAPNGHTSERDFTTGASTEYQCCATCGARIWGGYATGPMYDTGALVGVDCAGAEIGHHYPAKTRKKRTRRAEAQGSPESDEAGDPPGEPADDEVAQPDPAPAGDEATD